MDNFFDKSLHFLGGTKNSVTALNIGSMDGVMFDEMIGYTNMYNFSVLYVEPIPYLFERLQENIKSENASFENSAISDYNGVIEMMTIDREVIDSGLVHSCFYGMSAVYPPKNGLGSEFDRPTVEKYGKLIKVPCITFESLLTKHKLNNFDIVKIDAEGHDYKIFKQIDLKKYTPKVIRLEWINLEESEQNDIINIFNENNYVYEISGQDIVGLPKNFYDELKKQNSEPIKLNNNGQITTLVTGLWDLGRNDLSEGWSRSYEKHYLTKFDELLKVEDNLIIFGDSDLEKFVWERRNQNNTQFINRDLDWFRENEFYDKIQKIRTNPEWFNQSGWIPDSTQAKLEMYNPLVMGKMFLLHDAKILDKFNSDYMFWIDAGLTNTVNQGYFTHDKVIGKLPKLTNKFTFITFPYETNSEIHGFTFDKICEFAGDKVNKVARGGFFGGPKDTITESNNLYYQLLSQTLSDGYMGTEESIFTIMVYKYPQLFNYSEIEGDGLVWLFFENLKNETLKLKSEKSNNQVMNVKDLSKVGLYVIGFNSPKQFETLIFSMKKYDQNFIDKPKKFLLDNSTDLTTTEKYLYLCKEYGFEHIKKDNLGICGGRQYIAEHFENTDLEYMFFFEDDMFFYPKKGDLCRNGFNRYVNDLYVNSLKIIDSEELDFLKLNFSEFYGDNSTQWSWYNVPQTVREELWPNNKKLPVQGLDPNAPRTKFESIKCVNGIPYSIGEVYYCNWPQIVSKKGNTKMFLETKWGHPFEQTWMSHIYQETIKGRIKSGLLLLTPTEHDRFDHYDGSLRKES
jgi:FkbM family methyltransferase